MFFIFSKILTFFISPIIWILALLLYAVFSKNQTKKRRCLIFALVFFFEHRNGAREKLRFNLTHDGVIDFLAREYLRRLGEREC